MQKEKSYKKKFTVWLKKIFIYSLITGFTFILVAVLFTFIYEKEIKQYAITQINKQIKTKIGVKDIQLSLFKKFPYASLEFIDVKIKEAERDSGKTNLLEAKSIFLEFSIWNIINKKYQFKKIEINNGKAYLHEEKNGYKNFDILKKKDKDSGEKKSENAFQFDRFSIKNLQVTYWSEPSNQEYRIQVKSFNLSGKFSRKEHESKSKGDFWVEKIRIENEEYLTNKSVQYKTTLQINHEKNLITIKKGELGIEKLLIKTEGYFQNDTTQFIDLEVSGNKLNIQSFLSLLPASKRDFEKEYKSKGLFYIKAQIKGSLKKGNAPYINLSFGIQNGEIIHKPSQTTMKNIVLEGNYTNGEKRKNETTVFTIANFTGQLKNSSFKGSFKLSNLDHPTMEFTTDSRVDLGEIMAFIPEESIESMSGITEIKMKFKGKSEDGKKFTIYDYQKSEMEGFARFQSVNLKLKDQKLGLENCQGLLNFKNSDATIEEFSAKLGQSDFKIKGTINNLPGYLLLPDAPLSVDAKFDAEKINLDEWLENDQPDVKNEKKSYRLIIPENINFNLHIQVEQLQFRKFKASSIKGDIDIKNRLFGAHGLSFNSSGGKINAEGVVNGQDTGKLKMTVHASFNEIDLKQLFYEFENFNQKTLEDKHLRGKINAVADFGCTFSNTLEADLTTLFATVNLTVSNGELIHFKPMESLSKFIRVEELRDIRFSELKNTIEIRDEKILIPQMEIRSSALNLVLSGEHQFDNTIDYHFNVLLKDLLAQKFKRNKKEDEFGEIIEEEGGARIFIKMAGRADNPVISYDGKGVRQKMKEDLKKENQNFKQLLFEEFGLFKNDSTIKKDKQLPKKENKNKIKDSEDFEFE